MNVIENNSVLAALFEWNPDAVIVYNLDGFVVDANAAAIEMGGYSLEELRGRHVTKQAAKGHAERVAVAAAGSKRGKSDHFETTIKRKDGVVVPVECFIFPAPGPDGKPQFIFVIARDLGALRSAEISLGKNQERFRSLFEFHPDSILSLKADSTVSRVNVSLESATGFFNEKLVGRPWTEIVAPESLEFADAAFREAMRGEASEADCFFLDRLGNRIDMQIKLVPLLVGSHVEGAYVIAKNMTAQREAERAIVEQGERIRALYMVSVGGGSTAEQIDRTLELGEPRSDSTLRTSRK